MADEIKPVETLVPTQTIKPLPAGSAQQSRVQVKPVQIRWLDAGLGNRAVILQRGSEYVTGYVDGLREDGRNRDVRVVDPETGEAV